MIDKQRHDQAIVIYQPKLPVKVIDELCVTAFTKMQIFSKQCGMPDCDKQLAHPTTCTVSAGRPTKKKNHVTEKPPKSKVRGAKDTVVRKIFAWLAFHTKRYSLFSSSICYLV